MTRLPVSGIEVLFRLPDGADEIALIEGDTATIPTALRMLDRVAVRKDGAPADWPLLSVTDFEILLLRLRVFLTGGDISSHLACSVCRERVEISFRVNDYIARIRPAVPRGVVPGRRDGWLRYAEAEFRLPSVADLIAVRETRQPGNALRALCLADGATPAARRQIERVLERLAPQVTGHVGGACPDCGAVLHALFDVASYVVAELRRQAAGVFAEVHLLAAAYGWDEAAILALPGQRRRQYADMIRADRAHHAAVA